MKVLMLLIALSSSFYQGTSSTNTMLQKPIKTLVESPKSAAYKILVAKCNVCHRKKNPRKVFTLENMESLSPKIFKQVFVKKRMPKGKENNLSPAEYALLKEWLLTLN